MIDQKLFEKIQSLAKSRGFIYQSSEIYGGLAAVYDYGPYGVELANAIKKEWWKSLVQSREDIVGLDAAIFMDPRVWEASGHATGFSDPLIECKKCHSRLRVDHLLEDIGVKADEKMSEEEIEKLFTKNKNKIVCPVCQKKDFTDIKKFNLLVKSNLGDFSENGEKEPVYLRGETCQGIYVNYKNVLDSIRVKMPFGIAQIGKAFRNEITARQFIFRTREFEQMEMQYFTHPKEAKKAFEEFKKIRWQFYLRLGVEERKLRWHKHEKLVFYAKEAYDIDYQFPFGYKELEGIHARGDYDLSQHSKFSGRDLSYTDPATKEKYIPYVTETSAGVGRTLFMLLCEAYHEEEVNGQKRTVLKFSKPLAPVKVAVFPLLKNKPALVKKAQEIFSGLKDIFMCEFDDNGNIGKRYRRQDEIGTPYCITVDFDTLEDQTVTIRDRDTMGQKRVKTDQLVDWLTKNIYG
jgi:glycyl-tRNA synthetase